MKITIDRKRYRHVNRPIWRVEQDLLRQYRHMAVLGQNYRCHYCHDRITHDRSTADHKVALARGGRTEQRNILAACLPCNHAKADLDYCRFMTLVTDCFMPLKIEHRQMRYPQFIAIRNAWIRRHLNMRLEQAEKRIKRAVGMAA